MTLVIDEEFGSHLVMIDSTFFIVSSITDSENMLGVEEEGVEGVEGVESEEEKESVVEDEKRRASIPLFAAILLGVSDRAIEPENVRSKLIIFQTGGLQLLVILVECLIWSGVI